MKSAMQLAVTLYDNAEELERACIRMDKNSLSRKVCAGHAIGLRQAAKELEAWAKEWAVELKGAEIFVRNRGYLTLRRDLLGVTEEGT